MKCRCRQKTIVDRESFFLPFGDASEHARPIRDLYVNRQKAACEAYMEF